MDWLQFLPHSCLYIVDLLQSLVPISFRSPSMTCNHFIRCLSLLILPNISFINTRFAVLCSPPPTPPRVPALLLFELLPYQLWMTLHIVPSALNLFSFYRSPLLVLLPNTSSAILFSWFIFHVSHP